MRLVLTNSLTFLILLIFSGCDQQKKLGRDMRSPSIYKAWDARYQYDASKRKMVPLYQNQTVGRVWGRDAQGRIDYEGYFDGKGRLQEDLLVLHKQKLDQEREQRWNEMNQLRIEKINSRLLGETKEEEKEDIEEPVEDDGMDFLPTPFIPAGLDINMDEAGEADPGPFTPVPDATDTKEGEESQSPSPFLPLDF